MGSFNPVSTIFEGANTLLSTTKSARNIYGDYRDIARQNSLAQEQYHLSERDIAEKARLQQRESDLQSEENDRQRQRDLKRATAAWKAAFGSQGISTTDGSGQAVLLGLLQESDEDRKYRDRLDALRRESLAQDTDSKRRRNLLSLQNTYRVGRDNMFNTLNQAL